MVSLVLAVVYIPIMEVWLIKPKEKKNGNETKKSITDYVQQGYERILGWTFRHSWITICGGIATVVICLLLIGPQLQIRMMPTADRNQFAVEITLPQGKGLAETRAIADSVYKELRSMGRATGRRAWIGDGLLRSTCHLKRQA